MLSLKSYGLDHPIGRKYLRSKETAWKALKAKTKRYQAEDNGGVNDVVKNFSLIKGSIEYCFIIFSGKFDGGSIIILTASRNIINGNDAVGFNTNHHLKSSLTCLDFLRFVYMLSNLIIQSVAMSQFSNIIQLPFDIASDNIFSAIAP